MEIIKMVQSGSKSFTSQRAGYVNEFCVAGYLNELCIKTGF